MRSLLWVVMAALPLAAQPDGYWQYAGGINEASELGLTERGQCKQMADALDGWASFHKACREPRFQTTVAVSGEVNWSYGTLMGRMSRGVVIEVKGKGTNNSTVATMACRASWETETFTKGEFAAAGTGVECGGTFTVPGPVMTRNGDWVKEARILLQVVFSDGSYVTRHLVYKWRTGEPWWTRVGGGASRDNGGRGSE